MSKTVSLSCMAVLGLAAGIACYFLVCQKRRNNSKDSKRFKTEENTTTRGQCKGLTDRGDNSVTLPVSRGFPASLEKTHEDCSSESSASVEGETYRDVALEGHLGVGNGLHEGFPVREGDHDRRVNCNHDTDGEAAETVTCTDPNSKTYGDNNDYKGGSNEAGDNLTESSADNLESDVKKYENDTVNGREEDIKDTEVMEERNPLKGQEVDNRGGQVDTAEFPPLSERIRSDVEDSASNGESINTLNLREKGDEAIVDRRASANYDNLIEMDGPSIVVDKVEAEVQYTPVSKESADPVTLREEDVEATDEKREVIDLDANSTNTEAGVDNNGRLSTDSPVIVEEDRDAEIPPDGEETEKVSNVKVEEDEPVEIQKSAGAAVEVDEHLTEKKRENASETEIEDIDLGKADQVERVHEEGAVAQLSGDLSEEGNTCSYSSDRPNGHLTETDGSEKDRELEEAVICPERECERPVDPREGEAEVKDVFRPPDEKNGVEDNSVNEACGENGDSDSSDRWQQSSSSGRAESVEKTEASSAAEDKRSKKKNRRRNKRKANANGGGSEISNQF